MLWIGLTGSMGSGKSTVGEILRDLGFLVLDADAVVRSVLSPGSNTEAEVIAEFAHESIPIVDAGGVLDRRALGRLVFANSAALRRLEAIVHPRVREEVQRLRAGSVDDMFYDVPLLFEKQMESQFDHIVVVESTPELRRERLQRRTGLSLVEIEERWANQLNPELKAARASVVIKNNFGLSELRDEVLRALAKLSIKLPAAANS